MLHRFALTIVIALLPLGAMADAAVLQVTGGSGSSTDNAGNQLQTVSPNNLQGSVNGQSNGLVAPSTSNLQQAPANSSAVASYLNGELVGVQQGSPSEPVTAGSSLGKNLLATAILVAILGAAVIWWRRQKATAVTYAPASPDPVQESVPELTSESVPEPSPVKAKAKTKHKSKKTRKH